MSKIKKASIAQKDIGVIYTDHTDPLNPIDEYRIRYRVVSDDKTLVSEWSNIISIPILSNIIPENSIKHTALSNGTVTTINWDIDEKIFGSGFHVYARWNTSDTLPEEDHPAWTDWSFVMESVSTSASVPANNANWIQIYVQRKTSPKTMTDIAKVLKTQIYSTRSTTNSGRISELGVV